MNLSSILYNSTPVKFLDEYAKRRRIKKGYPETRHACVPEILGKTTDFKVLESSDIWIGLTLAPEGTRPASQECLDFIKEIVSERYATFKDFHEIPKNTIAVSMAEVNFKLGNDCQDFPICEKYQNQIKGYYSYKKLSESVQVTYFNDENGVQFLAGTCYYPIPTGKIVTCLQIERNLMCGEFLKGEPFPLKNRSEHWRFINFKKYGRYCSKAQGRVIVWVGKEDGQIVHQEFDPISRKMKYEGCAECAYDHKNYKWTGIDDEAAVRAQNINEALKTSEVPTEPSPEDTSSEDDSLPEDYVKIEEESIMDNEFDAEMIN